MESIKTDKEKALTRIFNDPELKRLKHLQSIEWENEVGFWKWIATCSKSTLLMNMDDLQVYSLKRVAHHEAGHAVVALITGRDVVSCSIIPSAFGVAAGETTYVDDKQDKIENWSHYYYWKLIVSTLAGVISEEMYAGNLLGGAENDVIEAIMFNRFISSPERQEFFKEVSIVGVNLLLQEPSVWKSVQNVASLLFKKGMLESDQISEIIISNQLKVKNPSLLIKSIQKQANLGKSTLNRFNETHPEFDRAITEQNQLFLDDINLIYPKQQMKVTEKVFSAYYDKKYWDMDFITLQNFVNSFKS